MIRLAAIVVAIALVALLLVVELAVEEHEARRAEREAEAWLAALLDELRIPTESDV